MSTYCNLAGLYPPTGSQVWDPQIPWQPIPVHTVPQVEDKLLAMGVECPAATQLHKEVQNSPAFIREAQKHKEFYKYLSKYTGEHIDFTHQECDTFTCEVKSVIIRVLSSSQCLLASSVPPSNQCVS
ncbi:Prostatic acid phosphatase [Lamellibrachia satsuma]|nr:Prostatic acid phosphatase [Lamellibrachia satsuma]